MPKIVGYMLTWTTYGSWLPGDERGYVENGKILPGNANILHTNKERQKSSVVKLNSKEKQMMILTTIIKYIQIRGYNFFINFYDLYWKDIMGGKK